ncbi:MAG TPA: efflux RND transporter periplasmic adaptor subunit [Steroidobacteraceae bacterium]|nr:efflux RND transporter periplasmic adaptor subunit [Steroidobacteraceae bacterium]
MEITDHSSTRRGRLFLWVGIAAGALALAALLTHGFGLFAGTPPPPEPPLLVRHGERIEIPAGSPLRERLVVEPAAARAVSGDLTVPGIVESDPARTATVFPALGGRVRSLAVSLGDRVHAGQELAAIDSPDLAQAFTDDEKAAATLKLASTNLERQEGQHKIGAASDKDLDQARSDAAQAAADYQHTQAHLRAIGAATDSKDRSHLLIVRSPFAGSITALAIAPGNMINDPTQPIMTVADLSSVWVTALVAERDLERVKAGQEALVTLEGYPGEILRGRVAFVSDVLESDSRRNKLRIVFANPRTLLKPNMFASVTLRAAPHPQVVLPTSALLMNNDRTTVFVATGPWTFERRVVEPELEEGTTVAIRTGLAAGEHVVVKGGILLND